MLSRYGKKLTAKPHGDFESNPTLPNGEPEGLEELSEIEKARRDLMLARLESFKNAEEQPVSELIESEAAAKLSATEQPAGHASPVTAAVSPEPVLFESDSAPPEIALTDTTLQEVSDEDTPDEPMETAAADVESTSSLPAPPPPSAPPERIPEGAANADAPPQKPYPLPKSNILYNHYNRYIQTNDKIIDDIMFGIVNADIAFHRRNSSP